MAEHFRASGGKGPAEPSGSDDLTPAPEPSAPEASAPLPESAPDSVRVVRPVDDPSAAPQPDESTNPQGGAATPPFLTPVPPTAPQGAAPTTPPAAPAQQPYQPPVQSQPSQVIPVQAVPVQPSQPLPTQPSQVMPVQPSQPMPVQPSGPMPVQRVTARPQAGAQDLGYEPHGLYKSLGEDTDRPKVNRNLEPTISMRHVTKIYPAQPHKPALEDVSLDIYPGEFVFIVGHSGSGKSTFLRLLTRELQVTSGDIMVAGQSLAKMRNWKVPFLRRQIGCVFQDFKLLQDRTTYENVAFTLECIGKPKSVIRTQVPEVLRLVGLADKMDMFPDQLSGGEQQRVSVARAMVNRPPLLICDEPTGNLDPAISLGIMKLLDAINRNGTTVIMATHDREMVDSMRKRVVALENGHLVRDQERGGYGFYGSL